LNVGIAAGVMLYDILRRRQPEAGLPVEEEQWRRTKST
jgi:hypothetical protein